MDVKFIRCFKLTNGESVIAEVRTVMTHSYLISNPMLVVDGNKDVSVTTGEYDFVIRLFKWMPCSDNIVFELSKDQIITSGDIRKSVLELYKESVELKVGLIPSERESIGDTNFDIEFTPDEEADYKEETFEDGNLNEVKDIHPALLKKINKTIN